MGILLDDPRISKMVHYLDENCDDDIGLIDFTKALAGKGVKTNPNIEFMLRVITCDLQIPEFPAFKEVVKELFDKCQENYSGNPADYIPELAKGPRGNWGLAICTVEGQRLHLGKSKT